MTRRRAVQSDPFPSTWTARTLPGMARTLRCLLGWHHYVERRNDDGHPYTECSRCGKFNVTLTRGRSVSGGEIPPSVS